MDLHTYFSAQLDAQTPDLSASEQLWDRRAAEVSQFTVSEDDFALAMLAGRIDFAGSKVLEISFGGGRHLLEFARRGAEVSGVEISARMLAHASEKLRRSGLPWREQQLVQSSWEAIELAQHGWQHAFDLVFLYMSPAISSTAMLEKVIAASRGLVFITLYAERSDSLLTALQDEFGLERRPLGSRGADDSYHLFNLLYQWGHFPELRFEERCKVSHFSPDYILERYASWLWRDDIDEAQRARLQASLERRAEQGKVSTSSRDLVAHLLVDVRQQRTRRTQIRSA